MSFVDQWVPSVAVLRNYHRRWLPKDVIAGLVLSALLVPQGMAYAELAGLPAVTGLYTSIMCLVGYAIFGPSRVLVLGPDSALGPMIAATILPLAGAGGDPAKAVALASMLALMTGAIMILAGACKLGFVADLLSKPTILGYMNGLALTIVVGQLPKLLGFSTDADGFLQQIKAFIEGIANGEVVVVAAWLGIGSIVLIVLMNRFMPKIPAVLVTVIIAMIAVVAFDLVAEGVKVVGSLPQGLPTFAIPRVEWTDLVPLLLGALGIALVALTDTISTATSFAERNGDDVDGNREMVGIGSASFLAGLFQGFPVSTSGSRTAVAFQAGAKSRITGVVGAVVIALMLLALPSLFANLPQPTLGAVVITAAVSLADVSGVRRLYRQRKSDFVIALTAFLGVVLLGVLPGILVTVMLSAAAVFRRAWQPPKAELGALPGVRGQHDIAGRDDAETMDNAVVLRFDAPLIFANARTFREWVRMESERLAAGGWVIIAAEPITDIDTTACDMVEALDALLRSRGQLLVFAELQSIAKAKLVQYGIDADLIEHQVYPTINAALEACREASRTQGSN